MIESYSFPIRPRKAKTAPVGSSSTNKHGSDTAMKGCAHLSSSVALSIAFFACSCSPNQSSKLSGHDPQGDQVFETAATGSGWHSPCDDRPCKEALGVRWYPGAQFDNSGRLTYEKQDHDTHDGYGFWIFRTNDAFAKVFEFYRFSIRSARVYRVNVAGTPTGVIMKMEDNLLKIVQIQREGSETLFSISVMPTPAFFKAKKVTATGRDAG